MATPLSQIFDDSSVDVRGKILGIYAMLAAANVAAWLWAFYTFQDYPAQLGTAVLAYTFGLRHAVDADHIAAIDNVTRKLMQEGKQPVAVGFFFSLGHSTIVVLASVAIAATATAFKGRIEPLRDLGGLIGTLVSATFLLAIATMNVVILVAIVRTVRRVKAGGAPAEDDIDSLLAQRGVLARAFRPLFRLITRSWQMYPLGFLFGLGFDTATEVGLLGIAAAGASRGMPVWSILVFPALFTAGMSLVDTTDSVLMLGAYGWAFTHPIRKLYYNITITSVSAAIGVVVGALEVLNLIGDKLQLKGPMWDMIGTANDSFGLVGTVIIAIFLAAWLISYAIYRTRNCDRGIAMRS